MLLTGSQDFISQTDGWVTSPDEWTREKTGGNTARLFKPLRER